MDKNACVLTYQFRDALDGHIRIEDAEKAHTTSFLWFISVSCFFTSLMNSQPSYNNAAPILGDFTHNCDALTSTDGISGYRSGM